MRRDNPLVPQILKDSNVEFIRKCVFVERDVLQVVGNGSCGEINKTMRIGHVKQLVGSSSSLLMIKKMLLTLKEAKNSLVSCIIHQSFIFFLCQSINNINTHTMVHKQMKVSNRG
jgi:hypothetical protein